METARWLKSIVDFWLKQIAYCKEAKERDFGRDADALWQFYEGDDRILDLEAAGVGDNWPTSFGRERQRIRINKMRQFVDVVLPFIFTDIIHRKVTPEIDNLPGPLRDFAAARGDDGARLQAAEMEHVLNYLPREYDYSREMRTMLPEMLVKGRGVMQIKFIHGPYGPIPSCQYTSVDNILIDADCEQYRDAGFVIHERNVSTWELHEETGVPVEKLRGVAKSNMAKANELDYVTGKPKELENRDIVKVYEVWSRVGMGQNLVDASGSEEIKSKRQALDEIGRHCFLQIVDGLDYPLNVKPEAMELPEWASELKDFVEWPLALFENPDNPFPFEFYDVYPNARNPWATSPLKSSFSLQLFMDELYTFLMSSLRTTCRRLWVASKMLPDDLKEKLISGLSDEVVYYEGETTDVKSLVHVIEAPPINNDAWLTLSAAEQKYEQISGMDPFLAGGEPKRQIRSAEESRTRRAYVTNKPNDFSDSVTAAETRMAKKEAQALRLYTGPNVVAPLFGEAVPAPETPELQGPVFTMEAWAELEPEAFEAWAAENPLSAFWAARVNTQDPAVAAAEMTYSLEAGASSRRNKQQMQDNIQMLAPMIFQPYLQLATQGMMSGLSQLVEPYNNLLQTFGEAMDMPMDKVQLPEITEEMRQMMMAQQQQAEGGEQNANV